MERLGLSKHFEAIKDTEDTQEMIELAEQQDNDPKQVAAQVESTSKAMLANLTGIFENKKLNMVEKITKFTNEICLPEVLRQEKLVKKNKDAQYLDTSKASDVNALPYVCLYNALSMMQRLPTIQELSEGYDVTAGFKPKSDFVLFAESQKKKECKQNLQQTYEASIEGRQLDGLLPKQDKYLGNKFMSVYSHFCKGNIKSTRQMYLSGLELQSKIEKVSAYDKCN